MSGVNEYDWDAAHEALESLDDFARMDVGVAPTGPYAVIRDLITKAKGWHEAAGALPQGMVLVPKEPTTVMVNAGVDADDLRTGFETVRHIYTAMLAAAPEAP